MPTYKDTNGSWYCKFYYSDYQGNKKQKLKRGFKLKREAQEFERDFLENKQYQPNILLKDFIELYKKDVYPQIRLHTQMNKDYRHKHITDKMLNTSLNAITTLDIKNWQNDLINLGFKSSNIKAIQKELSAVFNHAIRFYNLGNNPCKNAGTVIIPDEKPSKMRFWTFKEFSNVISQIKDKKAYTAILLLYFTGMRKGELYALKWGKIDLENNRITIDSSYQRLKGLDVFTQTKTYETRTIEIPDICTQKLKEYKQICVNTSKDDIAFPWSKKFIEDGIKSGTEEANKLINESNSVNNTNIQEIKRIHIHGLRHSHASYLISKGANIVLIAQRLGHKDKSITLNTYSHFFPTDEKELINLINQDTIKEP